VADEPGWIARTAASGGKEYLGSAILVADEPGVADEQ
jgi:hypothetical protein